MDQSDLPNSQPNSTSASPANSQPLSGSLKKSLFGLCCFLFALSIYGEIEAQWFNSYVRNVAKMDYVYVSYMVSASGIFGAIFFILWGAYSDNLRTKHGRRMPLLLIGGLTTALFVILFTVTTKYWWLFICDGIIIALTSNMFHMANRGIVPDMYEKEQRGKVNTIILIAGTLGTAVIWISALLLLPGGQETYSPQIHKGVIITGGIILAIMTLVAWKMIREPPVLEPARNWVNDVKEIFEYRTMVKHKDFLKLFLASLFFIMALNAFKPFMLILLQLFTLDPTEIAIAVPVLLIPCVSAAVLTGKYLDTYGRKNVCLFYLTIAPIGCLLLGFSKGGFFMTLLGLALMFPSMMIGLGIAVNTWTQDLLPKEARGRFLGIINIGSAAGQAPGVLLAGWAADSYGIYAVFIVSAIFLLISLPLFTFVPETLKSKKIAAISHKE